MRHNELEQLQVVVTAASGGPLLFTQPAPSAILKPKNRKTELIQTRMIQKPQALLWVEVGKSACVLVGICELRLSLPARYGPLSA
jgi:hypothetical protein